MAGAELSVQRALAAYAEEIGIVFQLSDDIIDVTTDETGKTPGTDLREGIPTLPTLLFRRSADPTSAADARLLQLLDSDLRDDADLAEALVLLRAHRCVDQARAEVQRRADRARSFLIDLPAGPARDALADLCDTVVTRSRDRHSLFRCAPIADCTPDRSAAVCVFPTTAGSSVCRGAARVRLAR